MHEIEVIVACYDASGVPTLVSTRTQVDDEEYANGDHYTLAFDQVSAAGYEGTRSHVVCFDENDLGPDRWKHAWAAAEKI